MKEEHTIRIYDKLEKLNTDMNDGFKLLSTQITDTATRVTVAESELKNKATTTDLQACELRNRRKVNSTPPPLRVNTDRQPWVNILLLVLKGAILIIAGGGASAAIFN